MGRKADFDSFRNRFNSTGKVGKNEFSVDGKSFDYRDPKNLENAQIGSRGDRGIRDDQEYNPNSYDYTDPLYDYSKGDVLDAAKDLDIGNVNSKGEVKQILDRIRSGNQSKAEDFKDDFIEKKVAPRVNSNTEIEIPSAASGDATAGDNSIASSISQVSGTDITGNQNSADQNNSIDQEQAGSFLDKYKLSLKSGEGLNLKR